MTGTYWSKMVDKGYASEGDDKFMNLNLGKIMQNNKEYLPLDEHVRVQLRRVNANSNTIITGKRLMTYKRDNFANVKKILKLAKEFCGNDREEIPSGKNWEDMQSYIWNKSWAVECCPAAGSLKSGDSVESDEFSGGSGGEGNDSGNQSTNRNDKEETLSLQKKARKHWTPKGWIVYLILVCKHTRICDDFLPLFIYDGKSCDASNPKSRKQERKEIKEANKLKRKFEAASGVDRGMQIDEKQMLINLGIRMATQDRNCYRDKIADLQIKKSTLLTQNGQVMSLLGSMYQGNPEGMRKDTLWTNVQLLMDEIKNVDKSLEEMQEKLKEFDNKKNSFLVNATALMKTLPGFKEGEGNTSTRSSPLSRKNTSPFPTRNICINSSETPVSMMSALEGSECNDQSKNEK